MGGRHTQARAKKTLPATTSTPTYRPPSTATPKSVREPQKSDRINWANLEAALAQNDLEESSSNSSDGDSDDNSPDHDPDVSSTPTQPSQTSEVLATLNKHPKRPHSPSLPVSSSPSTLPQHSSLPQGIASAQNTTSHAGRRLLSNLDPNTLSVNKSSRNLPSSVSTVPSKKPRTSRPLTSTTLRAIPSPVPQPASPAPSSAAPSDQASASGVSSQPPNPTSGTRPPARVRRARALPAIPASQVAALERTCRDRFLTLARLPGRRKQFKKNVWKPFREAADRAASAYLQNPTEANLLLFLEIPKIWLTPALRDLDHAPKWRLEKFMRESVEWPRTLAGEYVGASDKVKEAEKLVEMGRLGTAARVLTEDSTVATLNEDTFAALESKHPDGPMLPFGTSVGPERCVAPTKDQILASLDTFDPDSAPGVSGWTFRMLKIVSESATVQEFLTTLVGSINAGTAPGREMLCASRLIALDKPGGGIRPIAVGEALYRLAMKAILDKNLQDFSPLLPYQLGVKTKGGGEPVLRALERALGRSLDQRYTHFCSLDASNAFNCMDRRVIAEAVRKYIPKLFRCAKWAYNGPSDLVIGERILESRQGVRQGDPLGPLLFSVGLRPALEALSASLGPNTRVLAYLDDIFIISTDPLVAEKAKAFLAMWPTTLRLNPEKCRTASCEEIEENGFDLLGSVVGPQDARKDFLRAKISRQKDKILALAPLNHQSALLLLRHCIAADLRHLQRCLQTDDILDEWDPLDLALWEEVKRIRGRMDIEGPEGIEDDCIGRDAATLPVRYGGLGLLSHRMVAPHARAAAAETADQKIDEIFGTTSAVEEPRSQATRCKEMWEKQRSRLMGSVDNIQATVLLENASMIGRKWVNILPLYTSLRLSDAAISTGLCNRTLARHYRPVCKCGDPAEILHEECCSKICHTARHNHIRDILAKTLRKLPSTDVFTEPGTLEGGRRNDIALRGAGVKGRRDLDYDVKVYSARSTDGLSTQLRHKRPSDEEPVAYFAAQTEHWLSKIDKRTTRKKPDSRAEFKPLSFSSGGLMSKDTAKELSQWREEIGQEAFSRMLGMMSVSLLIARSTARNACLLLGDSRREKR